MSDQVDKVAEFHERWDNLVFASVARHPDVTMEDWLLYEAVGCDATNCDPTTAEGRVEWR